MILSELIPFLDQIGLRPKKFLSQNFLIDRNIVHKILRLAEIQPGDIVLEIGPGPGALTAALLNAGASVLAIEKDPVLAQALHRLQTPDHRLHVIAEDALTCSFSTISAHKVVANLPYHITTPLLEKLFLHPFSSLTLMMQKEFAHRLLAQPGSKEFSSFTLFSQFYTSLQGKFHVPPDCFYPKPTVHSSVIRLDPHPHPLKAPKPLFSLIQRAFQQRRKMLSSALRALYPPQLTQQILAELHLRQDARAETLSLQEWLCFFTALQKESECALSS